MTDKDLSKLVTVIDSKLDKFGKEINKEIAATRDGLKEEIATTRGELREEIAATRNGLRGEIKEEIVASENRVIQGILEFFRDHVMPVIDENAGKTDVERIERKLDRYIDKTIDLESRVDDIELLPIVAHELKVKRKR